MDMVVDCYSKNLDMAEDCYFVNLSNYFDSDNKLLVVELADLDHKFDSEEWDVLLLFS
jgi:hypothetical protein